MGMFKQKLLKNNSNNLSVVFLFILTLSFSHMARSDWLDVGKEWLEETTSSKSTTGALSTFDMAAGLKEALTIGSGSVVNQLGKSGGFNNDPSIHIPLPGSLDKVKSVLGKVGMGGMLEDLETKMNMAAEVATPKAKRLFTDAIKAMTLDDVKKIFNGPDDSATRYFQSKMSAPLAKEMNPIVQKSLSDVGAVKSYDATMEQYEALPLVPDAKANMTEYVVEKAMDGIFHYLALEEAAIRENPAKRTTDLLKKVFGK
ncbi:MAG: DUF4197 domain-containing protein [Gammaproteobacteria bacterium]